MHACTSPCRLFDIVPRQHTGPPSYYVVHAWGAPLLGLLKQLLHHLQPSVGPPVYVWIDLFAVNQHTLLSSLMEPSLVADVLSRSCEKGGRKEHPDKSYCVHAERHAKQQVAFSTHLISEGLGELCLDIQTTS
jgi:hypothetical protein